MDIVFCENYSLLEGILEKKEDYAKIYFDNKIRASKTFMTRSNKHPIEGMFQPNYYMKYIYPEYTGKLTNNEKNIDFKYYFDENDRLIMIERYGKGNLLLNVRFYFYFQNYIECINWSVNDKIIFGLKYIELRNNQIYRCLETDCLNIFGKKYVENIFTFDGDTLIIDSIRRNENGFYKHNYNEISLL